MGDNHQPMGKITGVTPAVASPPAEYHCLWLQASWQKFFHHTATPMPFAFTKALKQIHLAYI